MRSDRPAFVTDGDLSATGVADRQPLRAPRPRRQHRGPDATIFGVVEPPGHCPILIDGEAVITRDDGCRTSMRCRADADATRRCCSLIEHDGDDLRDLPLIERKRRLARLLGKAQAAFHPVC